MGLANLSAGLGVLGTIGGGAGALLNSIFGAEAMKGLLEPGAGAGRMDTGEQLVSYQPGGGTSHAWLDDPNLPSGMRDDWIQGVNEAAPQNAQMLGLVAAMDEAYRAREIQTQRGLEALGTLQNSKLPQYAEGLGSWLDDFQTRGDAFGGTLDTDKANASATFARREKMHDVQGAGFAAKGEDLSGRVQAVGEKVEGHLDETIANAANTSQREMDQLSAGVMGGLNDAYRGRNAAIEQDVGSRGLSPAAARALTEQNLSSQIGDQATLYSALAKEMRDRRDWAVEAMGTLVPGIQGLEGTVDATYGNLANAAFGQGDAMAMAGANSNLSYNQQQLALQSLLGTVTPATTQLMGQMESEFRNNLANAQHNQGAIESQTLNWQALSDAMEATTTRDALVRAGNAQALADMSANVFGGGVQMLNSTLDRQAIESQMGGGTDWGSLGGGLGTILGAAGSAAVPGVGPVLGALLGSSTGSGLGGAFG